jgi:CheY-like chemotaxis protein
VLVSANKQCLAITDSKLAAKRITEEKFDAAFLDARMPAPDGIELTRRMREPGLNLTTPIMVMTGTDDRELLTRAFAAGASFFVYKPVDRQRILSMVRVVQDSLDRERRRYRRVSIKCQVTIESGNEKLSGSTIDLSLGGMHVQTPRVMPIGSNVTVNLQYAKDSHPLTFSAKVLRVSGNDSMGLQFAELSEKTTKTLQDFLLPLILAHQA